VSADTVIMLVGLILLGLWLALTPDSDVHDTEGDR